MRRIAVSMASVAVLLLLSSAHARPPLLKGTVKVMPEGAVGCKNYSDWNKMVSFARENDRVAAMKWATRHCGTIQKGATVTVEAYKVPPGAFDKVDSDYMPVIYDVCVRPRGEVDCLWITNQMLLPLGEE